VIGTAYRILGTAAHTFHFGSGGRIRPPWDAWGGRDKGSDKGSRSRIQIRAQVGLMVPGFSNHFAPQLARAGGQLRMTELADRAVISRSGIRAGSPAWLT
jgi:hypothetical protein